MKYKYFPIFIIFNIFFAVENEEVSIFVFLFDVPKFCGLYSRLDEWAGWGGGVLGRWEACTGVCRACVGREWGHVRGVSGGVCGACVGRAWGQ